MTRNLKTLGLALVAVFAMSAVAASTASAQQGKLTSDGPVTLIGTETGELFANSFTGNSGKITCPGSVFTGHKYNVTPHVAGASGETTATITPHYPKHCTAHIPFLGTRTATVTTNGCDFVFHIGSTTGGVANTYGVTADQVCPVGKSIEVHVYCAGCSHVDTNSICTIKTPAQSGLVGPHVTSAPPHINIQGTFTNIKSSESGSLCSGETTTSQLHIDITVKDSKGTSISISH
jgi:hypothetical protein